MTTLREIIEGFEYDKESYDNPGRYLDNEYYIRCEAKVDVLEDVIRILTRFDQEQKDLCV